MSQRAEKNETEIPRGYMMDANEHLVPIKTIKQIDLDRDKLVIDVVKKAKKIRDPLAEFKKQTSQRIEDFIKHSAAQYDAKVGGSKGNVSLYSFDGKYKLMRTFTDFLQFDEQIQVAKALIDECIMAWSKGSNVNIKAIVMKAFKADKQGNLSIQRVLELKQHNFKDEKWVQAMKAIDNSMHMVGRKSYLRIYERDAQGQYQPMSLDIAAL